MDPNANLKEQLELIEKILSSRYEGANPVDPDDVDRLAELAASLNEWIKSGGFLPEEWLGAWLKPMRDAIAEAHGFESEEEMPGFEASVMSLCSLVKKQNNLELQLQAAALLLAAANDKGLNPNVCRRQFEEIANLTETHIKDAEQG